MRYNDMEGIERMAAQMYSTYKECMEAVQQDWRAIRRVPKKMRTLEICMEAVQQNGFAIKHVPKKMKTHEIWIEVVQHLGGFLHLVPDEMKTADLCMAAVRQYGGSLYHVPAWMKTPELCMEAVRQRGLALQYVPKEFHTTELIAVAVANNPAAAQFIIPKNIIIIQHGIPKKMPEKAYDTLEMGYDEDTAIQDGELMVDFHEEFKHGRFYRKKTFEDMVLKSELNPTTREMIKEYTIYQARV